MLKVVFFCYSKSSDLFFKRFLLIRNFLTIQIKLSSNFLSIPRLTYIYSNSVDLSTFFQLSFFPFCVFLSAKNPGFACKKTSSFPPFLLLRPPSQRTISKKKIFFCLKVQIWNLQSNIVRPEKSRTDNKTPFPQPLNFPKYFFLILINKEEKKICEKVLVIWRHSFAD